MRPAILGALVPVLLAACPRPPAPGEPVAGLSSAERQRFDSGRAVFDSVFTIETGLGPLFNADACGECHENPASGGSGDEIEIHGTAFDSATALCDPLADRGGPVFQQRVTPALGAALGIDRESLPPPPAARALRTSPDILGFGLLDAVPDSAILAYADPGDRDGDGVSGRPNRFLDGRLGRFGRKAFLPALREFNDGAFLIEQGITSAAVPTEELPHGNPLPPGTDPTPEPEIGPDALALIDFFVRFLAPPAAQRRSGDARRGADLFASAGCATCHVPSLRTGGNAPSPLRDREVAAYTDLLLHDMGADLADVCLGLATPAEFRTEPLMGVRLASRFLHDGRATSLEEAIELHDGEGAASRDRFRALSERDRAAVIAFLNTL
jgi:CxxC motif-containing protein (DUF1111 family)